MTALLLAMVPSTLPAASLGRLVFTITKGTASCGGPSLSPPALPPFSGEIDDTNGSRRTGLGLGCLYFGGGRAGVFPGTAIPDGGRSVLGVTGVSLAGLALTLGPDPGSGPADCTLGAGPGHHCLNGSSGTDGMGACRSDVDCPGNAVAGACDVDARCFFGAPVPVSVGPLSSCIVNAIAHNVRGSANLLTRKTSLDATLSARVYLTSDDTSPCPQCVAGACSAGERAGLPCSGGVGSANTTIECPPSADTFQGRLAVALTPVTTGASQLASATGAFCPRQRTPGAFGGPAGGIREMGAPLLSQIPNVFATTLAGVFCVPPTGNFLIDALADLPGPGAVSIPGTAAVELF
ncbi:MAG TPA: hypothetical protein VKU61_03680 [Candidatus Binatia bacterium]|nr:hypothetical protein [Candidatus Binatia bacterium]